MQREQSSCFETPSSSIRSSIRQSTSATKDAGKLDKICIFCQKQLKYINGSNSKEKLSSCMELRARQKVRKASAIKEYARIAATCSDELIAKEDMYRIISIIHVCALQQYLKTVVIMMSQIPYLHMKDILFELRINPDIMEYSMEVNLLEKEMMQQGVVDESTIAAAKKNLRRRIENNINGFNFTNVDRKLYLHPDSLDISQFAQKYIKLKSKIDGLNNSQENERTIMVAANIIHLTTRIIFKHTDNMP